jgi:DNA (cytosine-5)-methyltransferase 1
MMDTDRVDAKDRRYLEPSQVPYQKAAATPGAGVVDFCCGAGGLSLAAKQLGHDIVAGVDVNKDSLKTFAYNFLSAASINETIGGNKAIEACKQAIKNKLRKNQSLIIVSGPPCQGFSAAGTRDPKDKRNKILLSVARAIVALRPTCAVIENVQELLTLKHGDRLKHFENQLKSGAYTLEPVELNARDFGVPQNRKRAFLLVTRKKLNKERLMERFDTLRTPEVACSTY